MSNHKECCLCGAATFEMAGPIRGIGNYPCSKCRKVSRKAGNAQFVVLIEHLNWVSDEEDGQVFKLSEGWGPSRCGTCGSPFPDTHDGLRTWVQAGLIDDPLSTDIKLRIFCGSRANWARELPVAQPYDEAPK